MRKIIIILLVQFIGNNSFSQDTYWKEINIDKYLTLSLPDNFNSIDSFIIRDGKKYDLKLFKANLKSSTIGITIMDCGKSMNPYENIYYENGFIELKKGFNENAESKGLKVDFFDTKVDNVAGFKAILYSDNSKKNILYINYVFWVDNYNYSFIAVPLNNDDTENEVNINKLINSIHFNKKEILDSISLNFNGEGPKIYCVQQLGRLYVISTGLSLW